MNNFKKLILLKDNDQLGLKKGQIIYISLNEKFLNIKKQIVTNYNTFKNVEFFVNPTISEYNQIKDRYGSTRGYITKNGDLYIWTGDIFHEYGIKNLIEQGILKGNEADLNENISNQGMPIIIINQILYRGEQLESLDSFEKNLQIKYYKFCQQKNNWIIFDYGWKDRRFSDEV